MLGGLHVGACGEFAHGDGVAVNLGHRKHGEGFDGPGLRHHVEKQRHGVVELIERYLEVGDRGLDAIVLGLALHHSYFGAAVSFLEVAHHLHGLFPVLGCGAAQLELLLEGGDAVVGVGYGTDYLGAHGLCIGLALEQGLLGGTLGVEQASEDVHLPAHREGNLIGAGPGTVLEVRHRGVGGQGHGGEEAQAGAFELGVGYVNVEFGVLQVGVVLQGLVYQVGEHRIGEHLLPCHVAECHGIGLLLERLGVFGGKLALLRHFEFAVHVAARQSEGRGGTDGRYYYDVGQFHFNEW